MGAGFSMIVFIAAWLSLSVVVDAQSRERDAWGNWGYDGTRAERALQEGGTEPGAIWKLPVLSLWS